MAKLTELREMLLQLRAYIGSEAFERRFAKGGIDRETLTDFLAFDGQLTSVRDRMMSAFLRVVGTLN